MSQNKVQYFQKKFGVMHKKEGLKKAKDSGQMWYKGSFDIKEKIAKVLAIFSFYGVTAPKLIILAVMNLQLCSTSSFS